MNKILFLSILITFMLGLASCGDTGNSCKVDEECGKGSGERCYAGYCGTSSPKAGFNLLLDFKDEGRTALKCEDIGLKNNDEVTVVIKSNEKEDKSYLIKIKPFCKLINKNNNNENYAGFKIDGLWPGKDYYVDIYFKGEKKKSFKVETSILFKTIEKEIKLEKPVEARMTIKWNLNKNGDEFSECRDGVSKFKIKMGDDVLADTDNTYNSYNVISCDDLSFSTTVSKIGETNLYIYAVNFRDEKKYKYEGTITITRDNLNDRKFTKKFTLTYVKNNK